MSSICGIYKIINTINNKIYIGSSNNIKLRWRGHKYLLRKGTHPNIKLQRSWNKYGEDAFEFFIVLTCPENQLLEKEQEAFTLFNPWFNICKIAGNTTGVPCSDSSKEKLRIANSKPKSEETKIRMRAYHAKVREQLEQGIITRARADWSEESKQNLSKRRKGIKPEAACLANTGRKRSEETKAKIGAANTGKSPTEEVRQRISKKLTGVPLSEERKQAMRGPRKPQTPEQIAKRVAARKATLERQGRTH